MSWKVEVIADNSGEWVANALRFETREQADDWADNLADRWLAVRAWRSVESADVVNRPREVAA